MKKSFAFRADIQGLRAIAVLAVMLFHWNRELLPSGFIGVDVFFVISGFLMTSILIATKSSSEFSLRKALIQFYINRIKRIAPAYYFLLLVTFFLASVVFITADFSFFKQSFKSALTFTSNQYFATFGNYFAPSSDELPLLHTWSLAVEMQFYLLYPMIVFFLPEKILKSAVIFVLISVTLWVEYSLTAESRQAMYYSLLARVPAFLLGACAYFFAQQVQKYNVIATVFGWGVLLISFVVIDSDMKFPGLTALLPVLATALLIARGLRAPLPSNLLQWPLLVWVGALSYSLYLWHWVVLAFIRYLTGQYELSLTASLIYWGGSFLLAALSYYWIEKIFRKTNKNSKAEFLKWAPLAASLFVITLFPSKINTLMSKPVSIELTRYAEDAKICHGHIYKNCNVGVDKPVLVIGDSHAAMLNLFFDEIGKKYNTTFKVITASSCVPIEGFDYERISNWAHKPCLQQIEIVKRELNQAEKVVFGGKWAYQFESEKNKAALQSFFTKNKDKSIILLADIPNLLEFNPSRSQHLRKLHLDFMVKKQNKKTPHANQWLNQIAAEHSNVTFLDLIHDNPLFADVPFYREKLIYYDAHHLNEVGSVLYAKSSNINVLLHSLSMVH